MSRKVNNITGRQFGLLTVLERAGSHKTGQVMWRCQCQCGGIRDVMSQSLLRGGTRSCGCLVQATAKQRENFKAAAQEAARTGMAAMDGDGCSITFNGKTQSMMDWARELNVNYQLIQYRLKHGWDVAKTLTTPSRKRKAH